MATSNASATLSKNSLMSGADMIESFQKQVDDMVKFGVASSSHAKFSQWSKAKLTCPVVLIGTVDIQVNW